MQRLLARPTVSISRLVALGLAASATAGCASSGGADASRERSEDAGYRVVVAPLNLVFPLPTELDDEPVYVFAELLRYYVEQDAHVATVAAPDAIELWREATAATPEGDGRTRLDAVARSFVRALGEHADFDLVVLPALIHREVRLMRGLARWDGVQRRLRVRDRGTPGRWTTLAWNRNVSALSLHVLFVTRDAGQVSEGRGGISLLQEAFVDSDGAAHARLEPSREIVSSPNDVREAVARALAAAPLL